ncbi:SDR family oxidoreductase [Nitrosospira sp. Nsp11]|uniref:SDR family oxidoreductase n=1 Tax=Nitrosospira sp. Nsp11 TaxID=1855338 RepID=UPI00211514DC|nr:SDR family oxidoreductase [Nitrosospira sp. Nsp11]
MQSCNLAILGSWGRGLRHHPANGNNEHCPTVTRNIPLGRIGATEDIAEVVGLLVSDRGKFLTGANYPVDGGMTAR